jgi:hypothetical protein
MRGIETITLAALVGLVAVGVWQGGKWFPALVSRPGTAPVSSLDRNVKKELPGHPVSTTSQSGNPKTGDQGSLNTAGPTSEPGTIVMFVPTSKFVPAGNLAPGVMRSQLREQYGEPALSVVSRQEGRLVEQYYYNADQTHFVIATLHDGTVVHTETRTRSSPLVFNNSTEPAILPHK